QAGGEWAETPELPKRSGRLEAPFFARAGRHPGAIALVDSERRWSYGELAARASGIAARLRGLGRGPRGVWGVWAGWGGWGWDRRWWWASAPGAPATWWRQRWASCAPAGPTCRSTPTI